MSKRPDAAKPGPNAQGNSQGNPQGEVTLSAAKGKTVLLRLEAHTELTELWRDIVAGKLVLSPEQQAIIGVYAENAATYSLGAIVHVALRALRAELTAREGDAP